MPTARRPFFITLLSAFGIVSALIALAFGIFVVADRDDADLLKAVNDSELADGHQITADHLLVIGIVVIVLALVQLVVSVGLGAGSPTARVLFALTLVANAAGGLYGLVALHGEQQMSGAFSLAFNVFVLWYLFGAEDTRAFFHHGHAEPRSAEHVA